MSEPSRRFPTVRSKLGVLRVQYEQLVSKPELSDKDKLAGQKNCHYLTELCLEIEGQIASRDGGPEIDTLADIWDDAADLKTKYRNFSPMWQY